MTDENDAARGGEVLSPDEALGCLSSERRRRALRLLAAEPDEPMSLRHLADRLSDGDDSEALARSLHHVHLPKLAAVGGVEYDGERHDVRYVGDPTVEGLLDILP